MQMLIIAILLLSKALKTALKGHLSLWVISLPCYRRAAPGTLFIRITKLGALSRPMIDIKTIYPSHYPERRRDGDDRDDHAGGF